MEKERKDQQGYKGTSESVKQRKGENKLEEEEVRSNGTRYPKRPFLLTFSGNQGVTKGIWNVLA